MRSTFSRVAALGATVALLTLGLGAIPANAATETPTDHATLAAALTNPATPLVELGSDITALTDLEVDHSMTLDLKGFRLTTFNITILQWNAVTIIDTSVGRTGSLTATPALPLGRAGITVAGLLQIGKPGVYGGQITGTGNCNVSSTPLCGAGIGGDFGAPTGAITIYSGIVEGYGGGQASSSRGGSGIGNGYNPSGPGESITIYGGTVLADGGSTSPGISSRGGGGFVSINGGDVTAVGGEYGAGIGGSQEQGAGTISISGGTILASGGTYAAGIGGGGGSYGGNGGTIGITGATVTANPGATNGSGIGGGWGGLTLPMTSGVGSEQSLNYGAEVTIGAGAVVTTPSIRAVGRVNQGTLIVGSLNIAGQLIVPSGGDLSIPANATATVGATGVVSGAGAVSGAGTIDNHGSIQNTTVTTAAVTDHNYLVTFSGNAPSATPATQTVRVYAASMLAGARLLPPAPTNPAGTFSNWATTSAGGTPFTTSTALSADTTAYAIYDSISIVISPMTASITAGQSVVFTAEGFSNNVSLGDYTSLVSFSTGNPGDTVTANTITFGPAGTTTVTGALTAQPSITDFAWVSVVHGPATSIQLSLSAATVSQGYSLSYTVEGEDAQGNTFPVNAVVTSSVSTDVITPTSISFPHASPHVITAAFSGFTSSVTVQVIPLGLAVTGFVYDTALPIYAVGTGLVGILILLISRRRKTA